MALDINGYNSAFKSFVDFAEEKCAKKETTAIADATLESSTLEGRRIVAVTDAQGDSLHKWFRGQTRTTANDRTRRLFMNAVADMFGGESKIPKSVRKAMILSDYGEGKPLTARRIMAVKVAIDADGTMKARGMKEAWAEIDATYGRFMHEETETAALADGFTRGELKNLAKAVNFLRAANPGMSEMDAYREVSTPHSKSNRLFQYGGIFLRSSDDFARGLQLLDDFKAWHDGLVQFKKNHAGGLKVDFRHADTPTKLNFGSHIALSGSAAEGLETFVFMEIAGNPNADLSKTGEDLFGYANNAAMRACIRGLDSRASGTLISLPTKVRHTLYAAFDALITSAKNVKQAEAQSRMHKFDLKLDYNLLFIARVVKNFAALDAKLATGPLTAKDVIEICYPEIKNPARYNLRTINEFTNTFEEAIEEQCGEMAITAVLDRMYASGCTLEEAIDSFNNSKPLPALPHVAGHSFKYAEHRSGGEKQMVADLSRVHNYGKADKDGQGIDGTHLLEEADYKNTMTFPDGETVVTSPRAEHAGGLARSVEKVRALCGKGHTLQMNAVAYSLTQSANGPLNHALGKYGVYASEHVALNYELSKDNETGAVTIRYSNPPALPIKFSWTTTVGVDGHCSSTLIAIEP